MPLQFSSFVLYPRYLFRIRQWFDDTLSKSSLLVSLWLLTNIVHFNFRSSFSQSNSYTSSKHEKKKTIKLDFIWKIDLNATWHVYLECCYLVVHTTLLRSYMLDILIICVIFIHNCHIVMGPIEFEYSDCSWLNVLGKGKECWT